MKECTLRTTEQYIEILKNLKPSKDYKEGLNIGFNYCLAMMREELGEDYWKKYKNSDKNMVEYYSKLVNVK